MGPRRRRLRAVGGGQPATAPLVAGVERADSWATDAHKWLNVPYDSGLVFCAHPEAHRAAMGVQASYLMHGADGERDALDYNPEHSRGPAASPCTRPSGRWAERHCRDGRALLRLARRFADQLAAADGVEVLNEVVLNQVLVRFQRPMATMTTSDRVLERVQHEGTCWMSGTLEGPGGRADIGVELVDQPR